MEVRIRLQKAGVGAKKRYNYRIIAISKAAGRQGRALEILGHYDAAKNPAVVGIRQDKLDKWLSRGATMTDTVAALVKKSRKSQ